ncbi:hypothetical protein KZC52_05205 [Microbacterium sp. kSW2-24]|uniref:hypothetical protein n=1 Tax=Microbacterium galbinum TaxID=2851646 RepID=UPI001FFC54AA|nr:hypothetical protein [Microbacterium galbinum]MCK2022309.1 hypothetical protein [Microbacterium galbinum]
MRKLRAVASAFTAATALAALVGCTAVHPSAVRVNFDGSIDYVTCVADSSDWYARSFASERATGDGIDIVPLSDLRPSAEGEVVHFSRPSGAWKTLSIGASIHSTMTVHSDAVPLGEWQWQNDDTCAIAE